MDICCPSNNNIKYNINIQKSKCTDIKLENDIRTEFNINNINVKTKLLLNTDNQYQYLYYFKKIDEKIYNNVNKPYQDYIYYNTNTPSILQKTQLSKWCDNISQFNDQLNNIINQSNYKKIKNITANIIETTKSIGNISDKKKIELGGNVDIKTISGGNINLYTINEDNTTKTIGNMKLNLSLGEFNNTNISSIYSDFGLYRLNNNTNISNIQLNAGCIQIDDTSTIDNIIHHTGVLVNNGTINHLTIDNPIIDIYSLEKILKKLDADVKVCLEKNSKSTLNEIIKQTYNKYIPNFKFSKIYNNNKIKNINFYKTVQDIITQFINLSGGVLSDGTLTGSNLNIINQGKILNEILYVKQISNIHAGEIANSKIFNGMVTSYNDTIINGSQIINTNLKLTGAKSIPEQIFDKLQSVLGIPKIVINYIFDIIKTSILLGEIITYTTLIMAAVIIICGLILLAMTAAAAAMTVGAGINQLLEQFGVPKDERTTLTFMEFIVQFIGLKRRCNCITYTVGTNDIRHFYCSLCNRRCYSWCGSNICILNCIHWNGPSWQGYVDI